MSLFEDANLSEVALWALAVARVDAATLGSEEVILPHVLLALMRGNSEVARMFSSMGCTVESARKALPVPDKNVPSKSKPEYSVQVQTLVRKAAECAMLLTHEFTGTRHLLYALLAFTDESPELTASLKILISVNCDVDHLRRELRQSLGLLNARQLEALSEVEPRLTENAVISEPVLDVFTPEPPTEISRSLSEATRMIFRIASKYVSVSPQSTGTGQLSLDHLLQAFRDVRDPKFQLAVEAISPFEPNRVVELNGFLQPRKPLSARCIFEGLELSDPLCELYFRVSNTYGSLIEPRHLLEMLSTFNITSNDLTHWANKLLQPGMERGRGKRLLPWFKSLGSSLPVAAGVDRVLRRSKAIAASDGAMEITVAHLVPAWVTEYRYSETEFAAKHTDKLEALLEYIRPQALKQRHCGRREGTPVFGDDIYQAFLEARPIAVAAEVDRLDINHLGIGLLGLLIRDPAFEKQTRIDVHAFSKSLQSAVFGQFEPWYTLHNAVIFTLRQIDSHVSDKFWAGPASFEAKRMSKFELFQALSFRSELVVKFAMREADQLACKLTVDDLFLGLACETLGPTFPLFCQLGVDSSTVRATLANLRAELPKQQIANRFFDEKSVELLELAWKRTRQFRDVLIEPEHMLFAMAEHPRGLRLLSALELDSAEVTEMLRDLMLEERQAYLAASAERAG